VALTQEEIEEHAERIADEILQNVEYSQVYEDEELEDASEEEWKAVHAHIQTRLVTVRDDRYDNLVAPIF
jgi:flagellar motility protein MotE (MotC chaperone)